MRQNQSLELRWKQSAEDGSSTIVFSNRVLNLHHTRIACLEPRLRLRDTRRRALTRRDTMVSLAALMLLVEMSRSRAMKI